MSRDESEFIFAKKCKISKNIDKKGFYYILNLNKLEVIIHSQCTQLSTALIGFLNANSKNTQN